MIVDVVSPGILGTAFGEIACGSVTGGIFMNETVAWLTAHRSCDDCFCLTACVHPLALLLVWRLGRNRSTASG